MTEINNYLLLSRFYHIYMNEKDIFQNEYIKCKKDPKKLHKLLNEIHYEHFNGNLNIYDLIKKEKYRQAIENYNLFINYYLSELILIDLNLYKIFNKQHQELKRDDYLGHQSLLIDGIEDIMPDNIVKKALKRYEIKLIHLDYGLCL